MWRLICLDSLRGAGQRTEDARTTRNLRSWWSACLRAAGESDPQWDSGGTVFVEGGAGGYPAQPDGVNCGLIVALAAQSALCPGSRASILGFDGDAANQDPFAVEVIQDGSPGGCAVEVRGLHMYLLPGDDGNASAEHLQTARGCMRAVLQPHNT